MTTLRDAVEYDLTPAPSSAPFDSYGFDPGGIVFDEPETPEALWGRGADVLAACGEPTILYSATGIGKTTLAQRVALAAIGIGDQTVLGYRVKPISGRVLYVAADRPRQAMRSLRRMVTDSDREILDERWRWERRHTLHINGDNPNVLLAAARVAEADVIVIDSIKDLVAKVSTDDGGQAYNHAVQACVANDIDIIALHHPRKATAEGRPSLTLDDVYGSTWITAGAGSVIALNGNPGDAVAKLVHLKMPAEQVGPFDIDIDYDTGQLSTLGHRDLRSHLAKERSVTTAQATRYITGKKQPSDAERKAVLRKLNRLVNDRAATKHAEAGQMTVWRTTSPEVTRTPTRTPPADTHPDTPGHVRSESAQNAVTATTNEPGQSPGQGRTPNADTLPPSREGAKSDPGDLPDPY